MIEKNLIYAFKDSYGREPIIRKTKNGTLICICLSGGSWEPENKNVVKILKSTDNGRTWSGPKSLSNGLKCKKSSKKLSKIPQKSS